MLLQPQAGGSFKSKPPTRRKTKNTFTIAITENTHIVADPSCTSTAPSVLTLIQPSLGHSQHGGSPPTHGAGSTGRLAAVSNFAVSFNPPFFFSFDPPHTK
ncbi:hypothetical protein V6N11_008459 [Hibiscus sabdariffa]|uniref:Uncharacterized protein n=2 Tax=Hibiscus sabdariffa TaxID=183260 RepID=A0ABR2DA85_9ROSI